MRFLAALLFLLAATAQAAVGLTELPGIDGDGPVTVFYPSSGEARPLKRGPFDFALASQGAPPQTAPPVPAKGPIAPPPQKARPHIPIAIERAVRTRDGDRCTFVLADGSRCGSRWKTELDRQKPRKIRDFHVFPTDTSYDYREAEAIVKGFMRDAQQSTVVKS